MKFRDKMGNEMTTGRTAWLTVPQVNGPVKVVDFEPPTVDRHGSAQKLATKPGFVYVLMAIPFTPEVDDVREDKDTAFDFLLLTDDPIDGALAKSRVDRLIQESLASVRGKAPHILTR